MRIQSIDARNRGVALVLALLILLVLTIIGVATMNSTLMQERMAGNIGTQTHAIETAATGVTRALEFFYEVSQDDSHDLPHHPRFDDILCGFIHREDGETCDESNIQCRQAWSFPTDGNFENRGQLNSGQIMEQRMYCCRNWIEDEVTSVWVETPSKLFILNRGSLPAGEGVLTQREIEVHLDAADPDEPTCTICLPGGVSGFKASTSNSFRVQGGCGPGVMAQNVATAATVLEAVERVSRLGNYEGGITAGDMGPPWNDSMLMAQFAYWAKLGLHPGDDDNYALGGYFQDSLEVAGGTRFGTQGADGVPQITYVDGDLEFRGGIRGAGILIVRGTLKWNGTPDFHGLILVLGDRLEIRGGGTSTNFGSLGFATLEANSDAPGNAVPPDPDLLGRYTLRYAVATEAVVVDGQTVTGVRMMSSQDAPSGSPLYAAGIPRRPVLRALRISGSGNDSDVALVHYHDGSTHRFFIAINGQELSATQQPVACELNGVPCSPEGLDFTFQVSGGEFPGAVQPGQYRLEFRKSAEELPQPDPSNIADRRPRDRFGRLIPDFVLTDNYPPDAYGYDPNQWFWQAPDPDEPPFVLGNGEMDWSGGGRQLFEYDCQILQQYRHRLLCADKVAGADPNLPDGYNYTDPDPASVCNHPLANEPYNSNILGLTSGINNQHAWHLWNPSCECLGIGGDSNIILAGWRENLGWRDDEFEGCRGLPEPSL